MDQANQPFDAPTSHAHADADMDVDMDTNLRDMDMDVDMGGADSDSDIDGGDDYNHVALVRLLTGAQTQRCQLSDTQRCGGYQQDAANGEDPTVSDHATAVVDGGEDKLELVEQPQKVNSEAISYARVAKKIDVIALKRALSHQITTSSVRLALLATAPPCIRPLPQRADSSHARVRRNRSRRRRGSRSRDSFASCPLASRTDAPSKISLCRYERPARTQRANRTHS
jgi:hypothetical protein